MGGGVGGKGSGTLQKLDTEKVRFFNRADIRSCPIHMLTSEQNESKNTKNAYLLHREVVLWNQISENIKFGSGYRSGSGYRVLLSILKKENNWKFFLRKL